ncbi:MAG: rhomboid family intramembrane serine protease [Bacteroidales bacterium]|nr:rhomboid family intramembrane serine protease [Bacteroidales bacterium]
MSNVPKAVKHIILINVLMLVLTYLNNPLMSKWFALNPITFLWKPWQLVTYMFMHGGIGHLFFNMYTLFIFGSVLENVWGTKKFLTFYFVTGVGAALVNIGVQYLTGSFALTVGASGAIYGILMGYAMLYPDSMLTLIFPPVSLKAKWFVLIFAGIELLLGISNNPADNVAHFAHLGGLIFAFIIIMFWKKKHRLYGRN